MSVYGSKELLYIVICAETLPIIDCVITAGIGALTVKLAVSVVFLNRS